VEEDELIDLAQVVDLDCLHHAADTPPTVESDALDESDVLVEERRHNACLEHPLSAPGWNELHGGRVHARDVQKRPEEREPDTLTLLRMELHPEDVAAPDTGGEVFAVGCRRDHDGAVGRPHGEA